MTLFEVFKGRYLNLIVQFVRALYGSDAKGQNCRVAIKKDDTQITRTGGPRIKSVNFVLLSLSTGEKIIINYYQLKMDYTAFNYKALKPFV